MELSVILGSWSTVVHSEVDCVDQCNGWCVAALFQQILVIQFLSLVLSEIAYS